MEERSAKDLILLYIIAFIGGFCVMAIEIVAGRLISRYLGSSLYTWTSVIGIVLAGISLGNYLGGRIAERFLSKKIIFVIFLAASVSCVLMPVMNNLAGDSLMFLQLNWQAKIILHVLLIFFLPSCILGMISPVVTRLALELGLAKGRVIGNIYAFGSIGCIAGVFVTGFLLIPYIGITGIIWIISGFLGLAGIIHLRRNLFARLWVGIFAFLCFISFSNFAWARTIAANLFLVEAGKTDILYEKDSRYSYISIAKDSLNSDIYNFMLDDLIQAKIYTKDPLDLGYGYKCHSLFANIVKNFSPAKEGLSILNIGGGGYVIPRYLKKIFPNSHIEVVEIDPEVTNAAVKYFGLAKDSGIIIHHSDARNYIEDALNRKNRVKDSRQFDFILSDVFTGSVAIPYQLCTDEYNQKIARLLHPAGLYIINLVDAKDSPKFLAAMRNTLYRSFKNIYIFSTEQQEFLKKSGYGTYVIIASQKKINENDFRLLQDFGELLDKNALSTNVILSDDYAPVENLLAGIFRVQGGYRMYLRAINQGVRLVKEGRLEKALAVFNKAVKMNPDSASGYNNIASIMARQGNYDAAIENYKKALKINPQFLQALAGMGNALMKKNRAKEAIEFFYQALKVDPNLSDLCVSLGNALFKEGRIDEAIKYYQKAIEIEPASIAARKNLGAAIEWKNNHQGRM